MNRIDLHIHTKKVLSSELDERNIAPEEFKEKLIENRIKFAAITNHHEFVENFSDYESHDDFLLMHGIEIDVTHNGCRRQMNLIFDPSIDVHGIYVGKLKNLYDNFEEVVNLFAVNNPIILLDLKGKHTGSGTSFSNKSANNLVESYPSLTFAFDVKSTNSKIVHLKNGNLIMSGTDITDWDKYEDEAKNLLSLPFDIDTFDNFKKFLNKDQALIHNLLSSTTSDEIIGISIESDQFNITINNGINVIFGDKGTGKTEILEKINNIKQNDSYYYDSSTQKNAFVNEFPKTIPPHSSEVFDNFKTESQLDAPNIPLNKNFYEQVESYEDALRYVAIRKYETKLSRNYDYITTDLEKIRSVYDVFDELEDEFKVIIEKAKAFLHSLQNNIKDIIKKYHKEHGYNIFSNKVYDELQDIISTNNGLTSLPKTIGLVSYFEWRERAFSKITALERVGVDNTTQIIGKSHSEDIVYEKYYSNILLDSFDWNDKAFDFASNKGKADDFAKSLKSFKKVPKITNYDKMIAASSLTNSIIIGKSQITRSGINYNPSSGEKAIIVLEKVLADSSKKYILLDEPSAYVGGEYLHSGLLPMLRKLETLDKKIVMVTHNGLIGVNTIPIRYILRTYDGVKKEYETHQGSSYLKELVNHDNTSSKVLSEILLKTFEGNEEEFVLRKEIYEINSN